jgi:glycine/D-amino acid oxidase-like deaminating enzyme/nitrite reductase/ring-hydroxylating ferredoxin subunit
MPDERMASRSALDGDRAVDVCIVGAGIAGLSVAYQLTRVGRSVIVLEDGKIGSGETSRTTAHVSNAFDDRYALVERLHGEHASQLVAESHTAAIEEVERIVREESIDCQFERVSGYLFVPPGDPGDVLEREIHACHRAGLLEVAWAERAPLTKFETGRCLCFPRQGQFHPLRFLNGLAAAIERRRGLIFTSTHVTKIEGGKGDAAVRVETENGAMVTAANVVVATNTPINDMLTLHTKQYAYRTYVIGATVKRGEITRALYWDTVHPYHYARLAPQQEDDARDVLIVGGEDHKTGQADDADERYARLEAWARERFTAMGEVQFRWSGQVMEPVDTLAYIGKNPGDDHIWVATGDSGNGITHGVIAGLLLRDLILGRESLWSRVYEPSRKSLRAALEYTKENLNMAAQYASWVTPGDVEDVDDIPRGMGAVVRHDLKKIAVYRDRQGVAHYRSAVCPHLGAILTWNAEEQTWDCPAHGSRFDAKGTVLNGPANADLQNVDDQAVEKAWLPGKAAPDQC